MNAPFESAVPFKLERSRLVAAQVYDHLRDMIISLAIKPGAVLDRQELAAYFKVSLTPIRDALLKLEEEHLVAIFPQHATRVTAIDVQSAHQAHFLRQAVELELVHALAQQPQLGLAEELRGLIARQKAAADGADFDRFVAMDHAFHRRLYNAGGVDDLFDLVRHRSGNLDRLRRLHVPIPGKTQSILGDHAAIVQAIAEGDPAAAQQALRRHLSGTLADVARIRERYPEYLSD
ncbi:transcriptional regulator, GntR family [Noviherbaspirillum humi]|uniref:Transcriptional regulator, GntR family n=1 Tax=Noviherbaspirillum humi TaxID=1688639 RepID=A0A239LWA2_9BURK|nr:GntR family transcriptional regulator [Noviherbaspirillum humi]SNT34806.1 transcriptional regulator, GntR family [Noviherbaspirillum humi]